MKSMLNTYSKMISIFILISVLLCSVVALNDDISMPGHTRIPVTHGMFSLHLSSISELIKAEEVSGSASQAALIRQFFSRVCSSRYIWANVIGIILEPVILIALLAFYNLCVSKLKKSHRFIMDYIHKKDGKKTESFHI